MFSPGTIVYLKCKPNLLMVVNETELSILENGRSLTEAHWIDEAGKPQSIELDSRCFKANPIQS